MVYVTGTRDQIVEISRLRSVRSIYGNRTLQLTADPSEGATGVGRAWRDADVTRHNSGLPVSGRGVTVAVLDTGIDSTHADLAGRVVQNVKLLDAQAGRRLRAAAAVRGCRTINSRPRDVRSGRRRRQRHEVGGATRASRRARRCGCRPALTPLLLAGFDYMLDAARTTCGRQRTSRGSLRRADSVTSHEELTEQGVSVFSAGNTGRPATVNPYAAAPWSLRRRDEGGVRLVIVRAAFSSAQFRRRSSRRARAS